MTTVVHLAHHPPQVDSERRLNATLFVTRPPPYLDLSPGWLGIVPCSHGQSRTKSRSRYGHLGRGCVEGDARSSANRGQSQNHRREKTSRFNISRRPAVNQIEAYLLLQYCKMPGGSESGDLSWRLMLA
jgi:hypothetical protein